MNPLDVLQLVVGLPLVLVAPGLAWSFAAFPRHRPLGSPRTDAASLDALERGAFALAASLALVSLGALAWTGALGLPLGFWGSLGLVLVLTGAGAGLWVWRRRRAQQPPAGPL